MLFISELGPIGSGGGEKRAGTEAWVDANTTNGDGWKHRCQKKELIIRYCNN